VGRLTLKELWAHKLRLALTAIAIVLGVSFITGTYVLTDTLHNTFTTLFSGIYQNVSFQVRGTAQFTGQFGQAVRNPIPESLLPTVRGVPGVEAAAGSVQGYAQFVSKTGTAISNGGAPTIGVSFDPNAKISELRVVEGSAPTTSDQVVMDEGTSQKNGFHVGDQVRVLLPHGAQTFTISGLARFGTANNLAGATLAAFQLSTAQRVLGEVGKLDTINVVATPGADDASVQRAIAAVLPHGVEVVTGQTVVNEQASAINNALSFFSTALLVFAFIALFVGGFTIVNTFSIIVGQRTRELALLRMVGASRRQLFRSVLGEAAMVGLVASLLGIGLGLLVALGLEALLRAFGIDLPTGSLAFETRTVVVALLVGVGVTVVAAISPARRAVRIPPVAAISEVVGAQDVPLRRRFIAGVALAVLGTLALAVGLSAHHIQLVGLGAVGLFVGVTMLAPALARPLSGVIGRPFARFFGVAGTLGRENSQRSPRRTAQTASALMVGIALVSTFAVFGASVSSSATESIDQALKANVVLTPSSMSQSGFSAAVPELVSGLPGVHATTTVYQGQFVFRRSVVSLQAVTLPGLDQTVNFRMTSGSTSALGDDQLLVDAVTASNDHLSLGDSVHVRFAETGATTMRIGGIFDANALLGSFVVGAPFYLQHFSTPLPNAVVLATDGTAETLQRVTTVVAPYPDVKVQTRQQFEQANIKAVNQLLGLIYALLGLAVLIALIGIVNTLMLSVFERTHEIGLLRAVGMRRRQVRAMIRSESVILAIFGAIIGIVIGTGLGIAFVASLHAQGITTTSVPVKSLVVFLILAALLGLVAASWPARRAAKLDVLAAIASE
jgi:putative ABC transport system permease protein